jgi:hypothetical protein
MNTGGGFGKKLFEEGSKIGQSSSLNQSKMKQTSTKELIKIITASSVGTLIEWYD